MKVNNILTETSFLKLVYEKTKGDKKNLINYYDIAEEMNWDFTEVLEVVRKINKKGLIHHNNISAWQISITANGINKVINEF